MQLQRISAVIWTGLIVSALVLGYYATSLADQDPPAGPHAAQDMTLLADRDASARSAELGRLVAECEAAKATFHPLNDADLAAAKAELVEAVHGLDARLSADGVNGDDWRKYLLWNDLSAQLSESATPDPQVLARVYKKFAGQPDGLELVWFLDVRDALANYLTVAQAVNDPKLKSQYDKLIGDLAGHLEAYAKEPTSDRALALGEAIGWLQRVRQAHPLVQNIRRTFDQPNLSIQVSKNLVAAGIAEPVDDVSSVSDCILGTTIRGTAHTTGQIAVELAPDQEEAIVDAVVMSTAHSDNVGYHGPVTVCSSGVTRIGARKRFLIDAEGVTAFPAVSNAETDTTITGISSRRGSQLVERAAWKRASQQQWQAQEIASRHAEQRVNARIDQRAEEPIREANDAIANRLRAPLIEHKLFPEMLRFSTVEDALHVNALQRSPAQLGAPTFPPPSTAGADLTVRVHESLVDNFAASAFAGRTVREDRFLATLEQIFGKIPEKFQPEEGKEPWAISFARHKPLSVRFSNNEYTITLRANRYARGDNTYPGMNVEATYRIERRDGRFVAVRQGPLQVFPPGFVPGAGKQLSGPEQTLRKLLERRFAKVFEEEAASQPLRLGGKWERAGELVLDEWKADHGWMVLTWKRADRQRVAMDTP